VDRPTSPLWEIPLRCTLGLVHLFIHKTILGVFGICVKTSPQVFQKIGYSHTSVQIGRTVQETMSNAMCRDGTVWTLLSLVDFGVAALDRKEHNRSKNKCEVTDVNCLILRSKAGDGVEVCFVLGPSQSLIPCGEVLHRQSVVQLSHPREYQVIVGFDIIPFDQAPRFDRKLNR
jgi:hypothetical protein